MAFVIGEPGIGKTALVDAFCGGSTAERATLGRARPERRALRRERAVRTGDRGPRSVGERSGEERGPIRAQEVLADLALRAGACAARRRREFGALGSRPHSREDAPGDRRRPRSADIRQNPGPRTRGPPLGGPLHCRRHQRPGAADRARAPPHRGDVSARRGGGAGPSHPAPPADARAPGRCVQIALEPLPREAVRTYLGMRFADLPRADEIADWVHRRTEGNPLFVVALVDYLTSRGALFGGDATWSPALTRELDNESPRRCAA